MIFTEQHNALRQTVQRFVQEEINPYVDEWEEAGIFPAHELYKKAGGLGLLGISKPEKYGGLGLDYSYQAVLAEELGAAAQRKQGIALAVQSIVGFCDDDILFEASCLERLWCALDDNSQLGGANAMIINQHYHPPGTASRMMFRLMAGSSQVSYAGRVLGPAVNLLPEDRDSLPDSVPVEWLNLGCAIYRREAAPKIGKYNVARLGELRLGNAVCYNSLQLFENASLNDRRVTAGRQRQVKVREARVKPLVLKAPDTQSELFVFHQHCMQSR